MQMKMQKAALFACLLIAAAASHAQRAPTCEDLNWSAQVVAANPDIRQSCLGVYVRNNVYYARSQIELVRIKGNAITFRPLHRDGSRGTARRITVPAGWQATINGKRYAPADLSPGQLLNVYLPEDRFALTIPDSNLEGDAEMMAIEQAEVTALPDRKKQP